MGWAQQVQLRAHWFEMPVTGPCESEVQRGGLSWESGVQGVTEALGVDEIV